MNPSNNSKPTKSLKKLVLNTETVRVLTQSETAAPGVGRDAGPRPSGSDYCGDSIFLVCGC
ncbi:hypothetical protein JQX13_15440 [Archangium violaceum]|uniref:hypothetical protein n=1 Tax=Archangium violaceum TaxID=83451 RepID=UPI00193B911F|nr:hypothetical protein [Archangium violaceum]QRK11339.1 hypothetical protein JQX13_15440 [Archangium violaceum]